MNQNIIVTGGSGLLGTALKRLLKEADYPTHRELDVADYGSVEAYIQKKKPTTVFHAAAFTSPPKIDMDPMQALTSNIIGTANVVRACMKYGIRLVYVSTDYVFDGNKGHYSETDPVLPVNKYAWSKLGGECAVRLYDHSVVIRTSFGPDEFPYEKAFSDQWTSRENVSVVAEKIAKVITSDFVGIVHIGGPRRTVLEYAIALSPNKQIGTLSISEVHFAAPKDTSLDTSKYSQLFEKKQ